MLERTRSRAVGGIPNAFRELGKHFLAGNEFIENLLWAKPCYDSHSSNSKGNGVFLSYMYV